MIHEMNKTTFLTAIFLSILATVAIFLVCLLPGVEAFSNFKTEPPIKSDYVTGLGNSKSIAIPKIITIQGAIPPAGTAGDTIQPRVVSFNPANGATGVPLLLIITATFSEPVMASTVSTSTFQVRDSAGIIVPGTITMAPPGVPPNMIMFKPSSPLASSKVYSVTITTAVKDLAGNPLVGTTKWSFTTATTTGAGTSTPTTADTTPPKVVSVNPRNGAIGIQFSSPITAIFSEPVLPSTVNSATFYAQALPSHSRIPGMVTLSADGKTARFQSGGQVPSPWFIIVITPEVRDLKGNAMTTPVVWAFSTVAAPPAGTTAPPAGTTAPPAGTTAPPAGTAGDTIQPRVVSFNPANGATGVPISSPITATFSEPVMASTVSTSTFQVRDSAGIIVPGTVTLLTAAPNVNTAMFRPSSPLGTSKLYSATITTGVKDLAGNPLVGTTKWSFTTVTQTPAGTAGDTTPLRVVSVKPANGATGVTVTSSIIVTFSESVQASTVSTTTFKLTTTGTGGGVGPLQVPSIVNVPGTVTLSADGKTATFRPTQPLTVAKYHYYLLTGVKDLAGNPLTPFPNLAGSFTTSSP